MNWNSDDTFAGDAEEEQGLSDRDRQEEGNGQASGDGGDEDDVSSDSNKRKVHHRRQLLSSKSLDRGPQWGKCKRASYPRAYDGVSVVDRN